MKICRNCNAELDDDVRFCMRCGHSLDAVEEAQAVTEKAAKAAKAPKVPKTPKTPKAKTGKGKYVFYSILQWVLVLAVVLILAAGLAIGLFLGTNRFTPAHSDRESASLVSEDGTVAIHLDYAPHALTFSNQNSTQLAVGIENLSEDVISSLSINLTLPLGLAAEEEAITLSADRIGSGATRTFLVPVFKQESLTGNMTKIILLIAVTAVLTTLFILLFAICRRKRLHLFNRMMAAVLVLALLLPDFSVFAASSDKTVGKATLYYDEEDGIARRMLVQVSSKGSFAIGEGRDGDLTYTVDYAMEQQLIVDVKVDSDDMLQISWNEINGAEQYRICVAYEDLEFTTLDTVTGTEYKTAFPSGSSVIYYRVIAETKNGEMYSQNTRLLTLGGNRIFVDSDGDLLSNDLEKAFGTSLVMDDTDGDGLSDYYEIACSLTDPLAYDSDGSGISDGEKDLDGDGLTNLEEAQYGTNPHNADSDGDGLSDLEEIKVLFTDPTNWDTDGDGLSDGTEYRISSDPNSADSDGDGISDAESSFTTSLTDSSETGVKLEVTDSGLGLSVSKITDITDSTTLKDLDYVVSPIVKVEVSNQSVGSVTVPIIKEMEGGGGIVIAAYNEENGDFRILEGSTVSTDGKSVSAPLTDEYFMPTESVSENGNTVATRRMIYCAFYVANWHMQFEAPLSPDRDEVFFDIEFVIDESSSMEDNSKGTTNDPNRYRVSAAKAFINQLIPGDRAAVVGFNDSARRKNDLTEDLDAVSAAVDAIVGNAGGTALYRGIQEALDELIEMEDPARGRFIIALTDGEDSSDGTEQYDRIIELCIEHQIPIYTIALGTSVNTNLLSKLATYTGGSFFHIKSADDLPHAFNRIQNNAFYGIDTDGDGLPDDVEEHGLRDGTGSIYYTDPNTRFTDGDDMSDGEEAGNVMYLQIDNQGDTIQYYIMLTDPTKGDTDGDGVDDLDEKLIGTLPWCFDTDGDGLGDGLELSLGYNPLEANYDGDSFNDGEEYAKSQAVSQLWEMIENNTAGNSQMEMLLSALLSVIGYMDPYSYDLDIYEKGIAVLEGALLGDFGDLLADAGLINHNLTDSVYYLLGQTILNFVPAANVVVSIRDAIANLLEGDFLGMVFCLTGLIPEAGSAVKAVSDVCSFLSNVYSGVGYVSEYAGKLELRNITTAPAFTYIILRAIRMIEKAFNTDLGITSLDQLVNTQIQNGTAGMTKEAARNFEIFVSYGNLYTPILAADVVNVADTIQLSVSNTALPVNLGNAVRTALGTVPGGTVSESTGEYTLVRMFDLESSEYANGMILKRALEDAVDRTAGYNDVNIPELDKRLAVVITDCHISESVGEALRNISSYAAEKDVTITFYLYLTTDDSSYSNIIQQTEPSDKNEAILIVPGITGSELVAGQDYTGFGAASTVKEGESVWLPVEIEKLKEEIIEDVVNLDQSELGADILLAISDAVQAINMIQMDSHGKALYKIEGKHVTPEDASVGALGTGTAIYQALYEAYGQEKDVVFYNYDWRASVDEAARDLETYINRRGYDKVTFVCHSMGGIVTSCYLARSEENVQKTEKVITVGTPYGGSPKALLALQTGKFLDISVADGVMRALAYNIPAVYDLLSYDDAIENFGGYVTDNLATFDAEGMRSFLTESAVSGPESAPTKGINSYLYTKALEIQNMLYASGSHIMNRSDIDAYIIAGYGTYTVMSLTESDGIPTQISKSQAGDGTVPLTSAVMTGGEFFNHPIYFVKGINHTELFSDPDVISLIKRIIDTQSGEQAPEVSGKICSIDSLPIDETLSAQAIFEELTHSLLSDMLLGVYDTFVAHCPVTLSLWDADGNLVGRIGSAGIDAKEGYEEFFDLMDGGETKQVIVPKGYTVQVEGVDNGSMDLSIFASDGTGTLLKELSFANIAVSKKTVINASVGNPEKLSGVIISVNYDGDDTYTLTEDDAETVVYSIGGESERQSDWRGWILLGIWIFMVLASIVSMTIIAGVSRPKKNKKEKI